jgi:hypothetical protein
MKEREIMKIKKNFFIIVLIAGILCVPAMGELELPESVDKPFLIGRAYPELAGVESLYAIIVAPYSEPNEGGLIWKELNPKVKHKLEEAGVKVSFVKDVPNMAGPLPPSISLELPALRVYVDLLKLKDSQQYIFCIQTSLARAVYLAGDPSFFIKVDVWKTQRVMQATPVQDMPVIISSWILKQVETFAAAWREANPPSKQISDADDIGVVSLVDPKEQTKPNTKSVVAEYKYVASKNSKVFHKIDCRWAKNISPKNLVSYNSREEAIKDGKKPCRTCKP